MTLRLLIADDHAILRGGLKQIIATTNDIVVAAEAANSAEALQICSEQNEKLDLLLLDITLPDINGIELIPRLREDYPDLPILMLSMHNERQIVSRAIKAGAAGYVTKDAHPEVLLAAIRKVAAGGRFVDPSLVEAMVFAGGANDAEVAPHELLSEREYQILKLIASGHKLNDIALHLNLSPKTVSTYKLRLMQKLAIDNNADLYRYALQQNLTLPSPAA
jgi:DNA-binding NarL/FixJ family response regulator